MITNVLSDIGGVGIYGVISICLFFTVFMVMLVWAFSRNRPYLQDMSTMPLHDSENQSTSKGINHEK